MNSNHNLYSTYIPNGDITSEQLQGHIDPTQIPMYPGDISRVPHHNLPQQPTRQQQVMDAGSANVQPVPRSQYVGAQQQFIPPQMQVSAIAPIHQPINEPLVIPIVIDVTIRVRQEAAE